MAGLVKLGADLVISLVASIRQLYQFDALLLALLHEFEGVPARFRARQVKNQVNVTMPLLQKDCDVIYVILAALLEARGWKGHAAEYRCNIGDVRVLLLRLQALLLI
jgi:hypothetical protein